MGNFLSIRKRFPDHNQREDVTWLTGDATPLVLDGVGWATQEFFRIRSDEVLAEFRVGDPRYGLISECELSVIALRIVTWAKLPRRQFFLRGSGNMNAISLDNERQG